MKSRVQLAAALLVIGAVLSVPVVHRPAGAQEFRVETEVFVGSEKKPVAETLTVFTGMAVYDFLVDGGSETKVFDLRRNQIVLLNPDRQVKAVVDGEDLLKFTAQLQARGLELKRQALVRPEFDTVVDKKSHTVRLVSPELSYQAEGVKPPQPEAVARYHHFADWYARLNALRQGSLPPFGRMQLNKLLADNQLVPVRVERTMSIRTRLGERKSQAHSRHLINWQLSSTDRKRIQEAGVQRAAYAEVSFTKYRGE